MLTAITFSRTLLPVCKQVSLAEYSPEFRFCLSPSPLEISDIIVASKQDYSGAKEAGRRNETQIYSL